MQCKGRLVTKEEVYFANDGPRLHRNKPLLFLLPRRCMETSVNNLCVSCLAKSAATQASLEKRQGKYIPNQACLFHGNILEPIPTWSRLYKGAWWCKQIEDGYTMSKETQMKAEQAFEATHKDVDSLVDMKLAKDVAPKPKTGAKMTRKKISTPVVPTPVVVYTPAPPTPAFVPAPTPAPPTPAPIPPAVVLTPVVVPKKVPKTRTTSKKVPTVCNPVASKPSPFIITNLTPIVPLKEIEIEVVSIEIDGRKVWLDKAKDKVYDLKYNYLGRMKADAIDSSFPDSDGE